MYSCSCDMESCTHILQFALLCVDLLGGLAAVSVSCSALWPYLFHIFHIYFSGCVKEYYYFSIYITNLMNVFKLCTYIEH